MQTPAIIDSPRSSDSSDDEDDNASETSETTTSGDECQPATTAPAQPRPRDESTTAPAQPRPRDQSPNSRKVISSESVI